MIYLINPYITSAERYGKDIGDIGGHQMPLGIYYLAAYLLKDGEEVKILDCEALNLAHENLLVMLKKSDVKIIGITSTTVSSPRAYRLAEMIRQELPNVKIVIGGPHMTAMPEATISTGAFDYGIVHEGEIAFSKLVKFLLHEEGKLKDIPNLYYIDGGRVLHNPPGEYIQNLDTVPPPARQLGPDISVYKPPLGAFCKRPVMNMVTSRGCPYKCIFCDKNTFGRKIRFFSAEYIVREIRELVQKFGVKEIAFLDDTFVINKKRLHRIFELLNRENITFPWTCMTRADNLDYDILKFIADNGCWQIRFGIESGNQEVLDFIKKGITLQQVRNVTNWCKRLGIEMTGFFMIGHHIDTPETIRETVEFALSLPLTDIVVTLNTPMPGTESYGIAKLYGDYNENDWISMNYWTPIFVPKGLTGEFMLKKQSELYYRFYRQPRIILQYLKKMRSWKESHVYIRNTLLSLKYITSKRSTQSHSEFRLQS